MKSQRTPFIISWTCQLVAAGILAQTLFFKFSGAPESVYIFSKLGLEPWGRWGSGVAELVTAILLVIPATSAWGAFFALGIMGGAILSHLAILGIVIQDDAGLLFGLACLVAVTSAIVLVIQRDRFQPWQFLRSKI